MSINNALRGMMMGLAVVDALGASVEFMEKDSFPPVTGYYGQLAGAFYGYDRIPREWIEQLHDYNTVNGYTDLLIEGITENDIDQLASSRCIALPSILRN